MKLYTRRILGALTGAALLAAMPFAGAQSAWPTRPVRIVIPFGPGGGTDVAARLIAQDLSTRWGQQVIVDNKPGGDTVIAASEVQRAAPDGYTLLFTNNSTLTVTPHTMAKVPFHPINDFTYVGQLTEMPLLVMASEVLPVKTFGEFVEYARARPGQLNAGGAATLTQLFTEQLSREIGVKLTWVMYKSGAEITRSLVSNEVQFGVDAIANNIAHIQSGRIKALAVNTQTRLATLPDVPTLRELGVRGQVITLQHVLLGPRGMQPALVTKIQRDVQASMASAAVRERLMTNGIQSSWRDANEVVKSIQVDIATTGELVKSIGLKPQ